MKTKSIIILIVFCFFAGSIKSQNPLAQTGGPVILGYDKELSHNMFMGDNGDSFSVYCGAMSANKKSKNQSIITYNKSDNSVQTQTLTLPDNCFRVLATDIGDSYFVTYSHYPKWTQYEYVTAKIPKGMSATSVSPVTRISFKTDFFGDVMEYSAKSPDNKISAALIINISSRSKVTNFHLFIYDETGTEIVYQNFSPEILGNYFELEDFKVTNDGKALILISSGEREKLTVQKRAIQLLVADNTIETYSTKMNDGVIVSTKIAALKNGNYFVGGFSAKNGRSQANQYFSTIFNTNSNDFEEINTYPLSEDEIPGVQPVFGCLIPATFQMYCTHILELANGHVMMLGEHAATLVIQEETGKTYKNYTTNLCYKTFEADGTSLSSNDSPILYKKQFSGGYTHTLGYFGENIFTYLAAGISFSPFVVDNDVYILYNGTKENITETNDKGDYINMSLFPGKSCLILAILSEEGFPTKQLVMTPDKEKKFFNGLWHFDGKNVYFGTGSRRIYTLEHFEIDN